MKMPSGLTLIGVGMVAAVLAWQGSKLLPPRESPYRLWVLAAGRTFEELDDQAYQAMRRRFRCKPFELRAAGQVCTIVTDGPPGTLSIVVDSLRGGPAVIVAFRSDERSAMLRDEIRKMMAQWNKVSPPGHLVYEDAQHNDFSATHWRTKDGRWSATIHLPSEDEKKGETAVTLRDERALAAIYLVTPLAQLHYANERLINPLRGEEQLRLAALLAK
jgi:hypothetical protein